MGQRVGEAAEKFWDLRDLLHVVSHLSTPQHTPRLVYPSCPYIMLSPNCNSVLRFFQSSGKNQNQFLAGKLFLYTLRAPFFVSEKALKLTYRVFSGSPVAKMSHLMQGARVRSLSSHATTKIQHSKKEGKKKLNLDLSEIGNIKNNFWNGAVLCPDSRKLQWALGASKEVEGGSLAERRRADRWVSLPYDLI